jgi:hypothetical protein
MSVIAMFAVLAGIFLGFRCRVFVLVPTILLVAIAAIASGILTGLDPGTIALGTALAAVSPQIGYLSAVGVKYFAREHRRRQAAARKPALVRAIQMRIGQELKVEFEPPQDLPHELAALLSRMDADVT